ncbi:Hsp20/alpha crystallin family protein [Roseiconus lacunae]|uniref:Hsp20/alpha crystallin family protein n=1 Tax=Roseiconus lacunae TaxID=2605694 RepID=UPI0030863389|nr:Hsp20/alpha crystallin family protein [Stieleria sp. HD01]
MKQSIQGEIKMAGTLSKRNGRGLSMPALEMFPQFRSIENMMSRMFDDGEDSWLGGAMAPTLDVSETDNEVDVKMDLPGMKPEEIDIQVHQNVLTIRGERSEETEEKDRTYHRVERRSGSFARSVSLPSAIDEDNVDANYKDGVLIIKMPKTKEAQAKKIAVKA